MKSLANNSATDVLSKKSGCGIVYSSVAALPNAISGDQDSSFKLSSSLAESSNCPDTSLVDLKLGRFFGKNDVHTKVNPNLSPAQSSVQVKRARAGNLTSQVPFCQVQGCKKDLSASKDYHKRHRVCEIHSKTAKVIVNGIEQRFCQQCSRFHLLAEFDGGKRSCRKRLAGHNERRRKHHIGLHSGRTGRLSQPFNGARLQGASYAFSSLFRQDILPSGRLHPQKSEMSHWDKHVTDYGQFGMANTNGQTRAKSLVLPFNSEDQCPIGDDGLIPVARNKTNDHCNSFLTNMSSSDFDSNSLFQNTSLGSEELTVLDSSSTVQGLLPASSSGCALSLLSSQPQAFSNISSSIPTNHPQIAPNDHHHYSMTHMSDKLMMLSPQASPSVVSNAFPASGIASAEETNLETLFIPDIVESPHYGYNEFIPGSAEFLSAKNQLSAGEESTIDLLQLSSQLHHVEHERRSMQLKQENDALFGRKMT